MLETFLKCWEGYIGNSLAPREVRKKAWEDQCAEYKKRETYLIEYYCYEINGYQNYYEQTFEEKEAHDEPS